MPIIASSMGDKKVIERLRGIIVGKEKTGKSRLVSTGRDPILFLDVDQRAESLAGIKGVFTITPTDPPGLDMQPTVYQDTLKLVAKLETSRRLGDLNPGFASGPEAEAIVKTVCLDSAASMAKAILRYGMYTNPKVLAREIPVGGQTIRFSSGWDTWNYDMECFDQLICRLIAIPEIDFFLTIHEDTDKMGAIDVFPGRYGRIIRYFNEVWRVTRTTNLPQVQFLPTTAFTAATTMVGIPGTVENPNIKNLIAQYGRK